jgi:hypothetical protein
MTITTLTIAISVTTVAMVTMVTLLTIITMATLVTTVTIVNKQIRTPASLVHTSPVYSSVILLLPSEGN